MSRLAYLVLCVCRTMQQIKSEVEDLLVRLELAAEQDALSVAESKPAVRKLSMLSDVQYVRPCTPPVCRVSDFVFFCLQLRL